MFDERPDGWRLARFRELLTESRLPGTTGDDSQKLTVRLYGKGVVAKTNGRSGSAATKYYKRRHGQLVLSKLDFLNGAFGLVPQELDGYQSTLDLPAFDITSEVDPEWLVSVLSRPAFYRRYRAVAIGSRKARRVPVDEFLASAVTVPPPSEQRAISEVLRSVRHTVASTELLVSGLLRCRNATMYTLLSSGRKRQKTRFKQTPVGRVPADWELRQVGTLGTFTGGNGFRPPDWSDHGWPIIRIQNLNGSRKFNYFGGDPDPRWIVEPGTLLFAWAGTRGVSFGPTIWDGPRGVLNQHIHRVTAAEGVDKHFLYWLLWRLTGQIERRAHGFKTSLVHVHKSVITETIVAVPSEQEQREIASYGSIFDERIRAERRYLDRLVAFQRAITQALLSGRVRLTASTGSGAP